MREKNIQAIVFVVIPSSARKEKYLLHSYRNRLCCPSLPCLITTTNTTKITTLKAASNIASNTNISTDTTIRRTIKRTSLSTIIKSSTSRTSTTPWCLSRRHRHQTEKRDDENCDDATHGGWMCILFEQKRMFVIL